MAIPLGVKGFASIQPIATDGGVWGIFVTGASISESEGGALLPIFDGKAGVHQPVMNATRLGAFRITGYLPLRLGNDAEGVSDFLHPLNPAWVDSGLNSFVSQSAFNLLKKIIVSTDASSQWTLEDALVNRVVLNLPNSAPPSITIEGYAGLSTSVVTRETSQVIPAGIAALRSIPIANAARIDIMRLSGTEYRTIRAVSASYTIVRPPAPLFVLGGNQNTDSLYDDTYIDNNFMRQIDGGCGWKMAQFAGVFEQRKTLDDAGADIDFYAAANGNSLPGTSTSNLIIALSVIGTDGLSLEKVGWKLNKAIAFGRYDAKLAQPRNFYPMTILSADVTQLAEAVSSIE